MKADGTAASHLTENQANDSLPAWSPDGTKIAFQREEQNGSFDIYVMNSDGSSPDNITDTAGSFVGDPDWQPIVN